MVPQKPPSRPLPLVTGGFFYGLLGSGVRHWSRESMAKFAEVVNNVRAAGVAQIIAEIDLALNDQGQIVSQSRKRLLIRTQNILDNLALPGEQLKLRLPVEIGLTGFYTIKIVRIPEKKKEA
ncbi:MAG: hypothetical protein NTW66_00440 [Candidatus Magasanikbacteria bacterium]|nr:hypothetical protein [Candidatus Magasanikbacteria bacterium]